jgi:hypothetical protein
VYNIAGLTNCLVSLLDGDNASGDICAYFSDDEESLIASTGVTDHYKHRAKALKASTLTKRDSAVNACTTFHLCASSNDWPANETVRAGGVISTGYAFRQAVEAEKVNLVSVVSCRTSCVALVSCNY